MSKILMMSETLADSFAFHCVGKAEIQEVPLPKLRDDYVLVKVNCVALNPTDWYRITHTTSYY